jgi:regulator of replication initiation timing
MPEIIASISAAISTAKKLKEISDKIKDADLRNLLADLSLELAEIKTQLADMMDENRQLKEKIRTLESTEGEPCPKCRKRGWQLEGSTRDQIFGDVGGVQRLYKCSLCGFSESKLIVPGM